MSLPIEYSATYCFIFFLQVLVRVQVGIEPNMLTRPMSENHIESKPKHHTEFVPKVVAGSKPKLRTSAVPKDVGELERKLPTNAEPKNAGRSELRRHTNNLLKLTIG